MADWLVAKRVAPMRALADDWDGEGAPKPSDDAIARAGHIVQWALAKSVDVEDVSADVLGGVAVLLSGHLAPHRQAWISLMNDGGDCVVTSELGAGRWRGPLDADALTRVDAFLSVAGDDESE
jgi:hypothetical protein